MYCNAQFRTVFLNLSTTGILGWIFLCCRGLSYVLQGLEQHPSWPLQIRCQQHPLTHLQQPKMTSNIAKCSLGVKLPPIENHWFRIKGYSSWDVQREFFTAEVTFELVLMTGQDRHGSYPSIWRRAYRGNNKRSVNKRAKT